MKFNFLNIGAVPKSEQIIIPCILYLVKTESQLRKKWRQFKTKSQVFGHINTWAHSQEAPSP